MPHLQVSPATATKAHRIAIERTARINHHATALQQAHATAKARAKEIADREPTLISAFDLGAIIAALEDEQNAAGARLDIDVSVTLHSVIRRLKTLLP